MGCGKSKPKVVTGNTNNSQSNRSSDVDHANKSKDRDTVPEKVTNNTNAQSKRSSNVDHAKKSKDVETIPEKATNNTNANTDTNTQRETKTSKKDYSNLSIQLPKQENAEKKWGIGNVNKVVADKEDVKINVDSKESDDGNDQQKDKKKQGFGVVWEEEEGKLTSGADSPESYFFSTRRDEEATIEAVISEGMSGTSEYYSPRGGKEVVVLDNVADEKGLVEETKRVTETMNEKPTKVKEENLIQEVEPVPTMEPKDSTTIGQEETPSAKEELHVTVDSSAKDPKTD